MSTQHLSTRIGGSRLNGRTVRSLFRFGTEIVGKLPTRGDGLLGIVVKALAIADAYSGVFASKSSVYTDIFTRYDLREMSSEPFVRLFFGTSLAGGFKLRRVGVSDYLELIEAIAPDGERLFFQEHRYGRPEVSGEFFHTPRFNFAAAMGALWSGYPTGLYLSMAAGQGGYGRSITFCPIPAKPEHPRSQKAEALVAELAAEIDGHPQTILLYGPPGTGKSSAAEGVARMLGGRLLKIDAASLPLLGIQELGFLFDALQPRFLLIDDFDRAPVEEARARVLFLFEHLKASRAEMSAFVTVNDPAKVDPALLRSGRIDRAVEIPLPDAEERADILARLGLFGGEAVIATDDFNHADLAALAERAQREPLGKAMTSMRRLRELAKAAGEVAAAAGAELKPAQPPATGPV